MELRGPTVQTKTPCGILELTVNSDEGGDIRETFIRFGRNGSCHHLYSEVVSRLIGVCLRHDVPIEEITEELLGQTCTKAKTQGYEYSSCMDAVGNMLKYGVPEGTVTVDNTPKCPECGSPNYVFESGCATCQDCGFSYCGVG